jgi:hypothetical protein
MLIECFDFTRERGEVICTTKDVRKMTSFRVQFVRDMPVLAVLEKQLVTFKLIYVNQMRPGPMLCILQSP